MFSTYVRTPEEENKLYNFELLSPWIPLVLIAHFKGTSLPTTPNGVIFSPWQLEKWLIQKLIRGTSLKPVEVLFIYFYIKNSNSFSWASPFNGTVLFKNMVGKFVCKVKHSEPEVFEEISKKRKP